MNRIAERTKVSNVVMDIDGMVALVGEPERKGNEV